MIYKKEVEFNVEVFDLDGKIIRCDVELGGDNSMDIFLPFYHDEERELLIWRMIRQLGKESVCNLASAMSKKDCAMLNSFIEMMDWRREGE